MYYLIIVPYHSSVVQVHWMLPHLVRFTSSQMSASEMIPLHLRHVKWFFKKLGNCDF
jgi:hypothetical protein